MELRDYLAMLRKQWWVIALVTLLTFGAAAAFTFTQTPQYQATAELFVSAGGSESDISGAYTGGLFVQQRIRSYTQVVDSPDVLQPVIEDLGLPQTPRQLADQVEASSPLDTVLIQISATDPDPTQATRIANGVAAEFATYVQGLEAREGRAEVPVKVTLVEPAEVPDAPESPNVLVNLALGLLAGLGLGVGVAVLRETLDTSVRSPDEAASIIGAPVLGMVGFDGSTPKKPLLTEIDSHSPRAEAFRSIRTNLQYVDVDSPVQVVVVTSSVANEGKTTTAANLALALAQAGKRVALLEGDLRRPRAIQLFGLVAGAGVTNVLVGQVDASEVLQEVPGTTLTVLASGPVPPNPAELLGSQQMEKLLLELKEQFDLVVIDAPPLLPVTDAAVLARAADGAVLVVRHGSTSREQLATARDALGSVNARVLGVVANMVPQGRRGYGYSYGYGYKPGKDTPRLDAETR